MRLFESRSPAAERRGLQHILKGTAKNLRSLIFIDSDCYDSPQSCFYPRVCSLQNNRSSSIPDWLEMLFSCPGILSLLDFIDLEP